MNTRRWLVNVLVTWHVSYKIVTLNMVVLIDILCVKEDIQKWSKTKICSFLWKIWKLTEKGWKNVDLLQREFEPQIFSNFPTHDLNFCRRKGDKIKSKKASKRDRTLNFMKKTCEIIEICNLILIWFHIGLGLVVWSVWAYCRVHFAYLDLVYSSR